MVRKIFGLLICALTQMICQGSAYASYQEYLAEPAEPYCGERQGGHGHLAHPSPLIERDLPPEEKSLQHVGTPGHGGPVTARGHLTLSLCLRLLLPRGWKQELSKEIAGLPVRFAVKKDAWPTALAKMGERYGLVFILDWENKVLSARRQRPHKTRDLAEERAASQAEHGAGRPEMGKEKGQEDKMQTAAEQTLSRTPKKIILKRPGRAAAIARRFGLPVASFCAWNHVGPSTPLGTGYAVFVEAPPAGALVYSNLPSGPDQNDERASSCETERTQTPDAALVTEKKSKRPAKEQAKEKQGEACQKPGEQGVHETRREAGGESSGQAVKDRYVLQTGTLSSQLARWCTDAHYVLVWKVNAEFNLGNAASYGSDFEEALTTLFTSLSALGYPLRATLYRANRVLEVRGE